MTQEPTEKELNLQGNVIVDQRNGSLFIFNCLIWIAAISPLYFPADQQKEARVLIKDVKEKLRKLRSMLGSPK
jgi:hypothetical protein